MISFVTNFCPWLLPIIIYIIYFENTRAYVGSVDHNFLPELVPTKLEGVSNATDAVADILCIELNECRTWSKIRRFLFFTFFCFAIDACMHVCHKNLHFYYDNIVQD